MVRLAAARRTTQAAARPSGAALKDSDVAPVQSMFAQLVQRRRNIIKASSVRRWNPLLLALPPALRARSGPCPARPLQSVS